VGDCDACAAGDTGLVTVSGLLAESTITRFMLALSTDESKQSESALLTSRNGTSWKLFLALQKMLARLAWRRAIPDKSCSLSWLRQKRCEACRF
jgi:hypothetical protein